MSLTSTELNYLVWRYLQESGLDLAAYALDKHSQCLAYEDSKSLDIISRIQPGCLVDLVQKGILYSLAEHKATTEEDTKRKEPPLNSILTLFGAVLAEDHKPEYVRRPEGWESVDSSVDNGKTIEAKRENGSEENNTNINSINNLNSAAVDGGVSKQESEEAEPKTSSPLSVLPAAADDDEKMQQDGSEPEHEFSTKVIHPSIKFPSSITSHWHPQTEVFAYGREDSLAVIVALLGDLIAESVTLTHLAITGLDTKNEISIVSWAPAGNIIVTSAINGELRAWSPDGKLKNIANTSTFQSTELTNKSSTMVSNLIWSKSGQLLLLIDVHNQVCLWNGNNLSLIQQVRPPDSQDGSSAKTNTYKEDEVIDEGTPELQLIDACWLDESKFAMSTSKNTIKIFAISHTHPSSFGGLPLVKPIGLLSGHDHPISILKFNKTSKILASCSDFDYVIKIWHSNSLQHSVLLNVAKDDNPLSLHLHRTPIISLSWLDAHVLMSVSMEGVVNIWNVKSGEAILSTNISETAKESIRIEKETNEAGKDEGEDAVMEDAGDEHVSDAKDNAQDNQEEEKTFVLFNAAVSSNKKWLVLGDDLGRVSIWDISLDSYPKKRDGTSHSVLHCLGVYENEKMTDSTDRGICDISWSSVSNKVCVSYKGCESIVIDWAP